MAVTLAVLAVISGVVVYAVNMMNKVEENLKPEENATSLVEEIQTLEEYKGDVVNILVCGIDYEEGRAYSSDGSNDGMTDMILYCQFDIKGGALRMLQIPATALLRPRTARSPFPTARPTRPPTTRSTRWPSPTAATLPRWRRSSMISTSCPSTTM